MDISINVSARANKQKQLLNLIPADSCSIVDDKATISGVYVESKRVPDANRYIVHVKNGKVSIATKFTEGKGVFHDQLTGQRKHKSIVVVIESPHVDEYENSEPISPAQGNTGKRIEKYLVDVLNKQLQLGELDGNYDLIISNPVQFQASIIDLHKQALNSRNSATKAIRDKVWRAIFAVEENDFHERLSSYEPKVIINACTAGLKATVTESMSKWLQESNVDMYIANKHPCMWSSKTKLTKALR